MRESEKRGKAGQKWEEAKGENAKGVKEVKGESKRKRLKSLNPVQSGD